jgi:hypothetical protein
MIGFRMHSMGVRSTGMYFVGMHGIEVSGVGSIKHDF